MKELSKLERQLLRDLAGSVYEAEAHEYLEELDIDFKRWREGEMLSSDLLSAIHAFDRKQSRDLWSMYQSLEPADAAARGVTVGLIREEVLGSLRDKLATRLALFGSRSDHPGERGGGI